MQRPRRFSPWTSEKVRPEVTRRELGRLLPLLALYLAASWLFPHHADDEAGYITLAERLTHGRYVAGDADALLDADPSYPDLWFGPGLPGALAPLVALDLPTSVLRLTGPVFLFAAAVLFYVLARSRWGSRTALIATYGFGLYPPFWALLSNLHSEPLAILCIVAAMLGVARYVRDGERGSFLLGAAALAGLALTRVAYGWVLILLLICSALWWVVGRSRVAFRTATIATVALIFCSPWLVYTYMKTERPLVWGNSGSLSLYWMSSPYPGDTGDWRRADEVFNNPELVSHRPFFSSLRGLTLAEQNAEIERQAIHNIAHHPWAYLGNVAANASRLVFNAPFSGTHWRWNDLFYALPNLLVGAAALFCTFVLIPRRRSLPPETTPFVLVGGLALLLHALVAAYPRMLAPIVPVVVWMTTLSLVCTKTLRACPPAPTRERR
jgi:4-amino-4-deoxy-L-arabinose transferase-like glycosyltransferase